MNTSNPQASRWFRFLPILAIAVLGIAAGAYVSTKTGLYEGRSRIGADGSSATGQPQSQTAEQKAQQAARQKADDSQLTELQPQLKSTQLLPSDFRRVPAFELLDVNGETISQAALENTWSMMFFGYTHCPDVCPITLHIMKEVVAKLENEESSIPPLNVVFVTVDPVRDTPEIMKSYIAYFDDDFVGISGELKPINDLTRELGIVSAFTANDEDPENYIVNHTASMLLISPDLQVRAKFTPPHVTDTILTDYKTLMTALN